MSFAEKGDGAQFPILGVVWETKRQNTGLYLCVSSSACLCVYAGEKL